MVRIDTNGELTETSLKTFKWWVLVGGMFNCLVALPLSMPFTVDAYIAMFNSVNSLLGFGGLDWIPPVEGANSLFLNTAGLALVLVGMILIYASKDIAERSAIALLNGLVRLVWAVVAGYYVLAFDVIHIMLVIILIDLLLASIYLKYYLSTRHILRGDPRYTH